MIGKSTQDRSRFPTAPDSSGSLCRSMGRAKSGSTTCAPNSCPTQHPRRTRCLAILTGDERYGRGVSRSRLVQENSWWDRLAGGRGVEVGSSASMLLHLRAGSFEPQGNSLERIAGSRACCTEKPADGFVRGRPQKNQSVPDRCRETSRSMHRRKPSPS